MTFSLGETFTSYEQLLEKKGKFEQYVQLYTSDSHTIAAAHRCVNCHVDPALKFYTGKICCVHGEKNFEAKGKGLWKTATFKQECPVHISLKACKDGKSLEVTSLASEHNHVMSRKLCQHLPKRRLLPANLQERASILLKLQAKKKLVQQQLYHESGKVLLLKIMERGSNDLKTQ